MSSAIQFRPATREAVYSRTCLYGPGGSGKTFTMLTMLFALAPTGKVAVIDTERGRARKYLGVNGWQWDTLEPHSFSPESLTEAIAAATEAGYEAIGVDSGSHYWMGQDGMQEQVDRRTVATGRRDSFGSGWKEMNPIERRMWDAVMTAPMHVVMTLRVKSDYVIEEVERNGRKQATPRKVGLKPVQRDGFEYEFDVVGAMDQDNTLTVVKTDLMVIPQGAIYEKPDVEFARLIGDFCADGVTTDGPLSYRSRALDVGVTFAELGELFRAVDRAGYSNTPVMDEHGKPVTLSALISARGKAIKATDELAARTARTAAPAPTAAPPKTATVRQLTPVPEPAAATGGSDVDPDADLNRLAARLFDELLACETRETVDDLSRGLIIGNPAGMVDISGLLSQDLRETLDIQTRVYTLGALAHRLRTYTEKHGGSPVAAIS